MKSLPISSLKTIGVNAEDVKETAYWLDQAGRKSSLGGLADFTPEFLHITIVAKSAVEVERAIEHLHQLKGLFSTSIKRQGGEKFAANRLLTGAFWSRLRIERPLAYKAIAGRSTAQRADVRWDNRRIAFYFHGVLREETEEFSQFDRPPGDGKHVCVVFDLDRAATDYFLP